MEKYRDNIAETQQNEQLARIDNIIEELDKKRDITIHRKKQAQLKDEVWKYRLEEDTIDMLFSEFVN